MAGAPLRVLTWNVYHCRDGLPRLGPTWGSTLLGRPADDGRHLHLNRKLTAQVGERIRRWAPDVAALQEVPAAAVRAISAMTGMRAVWTRTGPLIGPTALRDALAARNPDLWRGAEGNANVLLLGPRLRLVGGSAGSARLNPPALIARAARELRLGPRELLHWIPEPRRLVWAVAAVGGTEVAAGCVHCHNAQDPRVIGLEIARAAQAMLHAAAGRPVVLAGDLNAPAGHPAVTALGAGGWGGAGGGVGIDRILHRGLEAVRPAARTAPGERDVPALWRGRPRLVRLSDHDAVIGEYRLPPRWPRARGS